MILTIGCTAGSAAGSIQKGGIANSLFRLSPNVQFHDKDYLARLLETQVNNRTGL